MDTLVLWALICLTVALILFFVEIMVPSGGLLGIVSALAMLAGVVLLFLHSTALGFAGLALCIVVVPFCVRFALRMIPKLEMVSPPSQVFSDQPAVGATGQAVSHLRPVGMCVIDGKRLECLAQREFIASGTPVQVVAAEGMHVKVRPVDEAV